MVLNPVLMALFLTKENLNSVISIKESKCESISRREMIERFLDLSGINETAHQIALDMLGNIESFHILDSLLHLRQVCWAGKCSSNDGQWRRCGLLWRQVIVTECPVWPTYRSHSFAKISRAIEYPSYQSQSTDRVQRPSGRHDKRDTGAERYILGYRHWEDIRSAAGEIQQSWFWPDESRRGEWNSMPSYNGSLINNTPSVTWSGRPFLEIVAEGILLSSLTKTVGF